MPSDANCKNHLAEWNSVIPSQLEVNSKNFFLVIQVRLDSPGLNVLVQILPCMLRCNIYDGNNDSQLK